MQEWSKGNCYFDIPKKERDNAIARLLFILAKSIKSLSIKEDEIEMDDDVKIYLAHLLFAAALSDYQEAVGKYISEDASQVTKMVNKTEDQVIRYFIYKVNADHILVALGLIGHSINPLNSSEKITAKTMKIAESYYERAAEFNHKIYHRKTSIGLVLEKLSRHFEIYRHILELARKDFFQFSNEFTDAEFRKFCDDLNHYEKEFKLNGLMDQFLDEYTVWRQTNDVNKKAHLVNIANEIRQLNPRFEFNQ